MRSVKTAKLDPEEIKNTA
uniref:Uncharacterized protein n=1 Tax=Lepeophtheirus salmonis TaxID=72036 RepID=A0A0K2UZ56_LEPSM